jgi:2-methylisocitrate lyase-like PEP mutase family enzyme
MRPRSTSQGETMPIDDQSRRGFLAGAGLVAGGLVSEAILPPTAEAQTGSGVGTAAAALSKGARFRAALAAGRPMMLPVVESIQLARLCEIEGFSGGFMGGSGMAARNALPNTSIQTVQEVIDYEAQVIASTELPIVADGENGGGSPVTTYRTVQLERAGAAVIMLEDSTGPESEYGGKGVAMATREVMVGRIKAAVDARRDATVMIMARSDRPAKGYGEAETLDFAGALAEAGADAFFINGFTLDQQLKAKNALKKPLMIGSSGVAAEWHAKGVDMAFYHIDDIGIGAMYIALKEMKAKGGPFDDAAKWRLPRDVSARLIEQDTWLARAKKYGVVRS